MTPTPAELPALSDEQIDALGQALKRVYYYDSKGNWRGGSEDTPEWQRWCAVAKGAIQALSAQPEAKAQAELSVSLVERLIATLVKLGVSPGDGGVEHFNARLESNLLILCRAVDTSHEAEVKAQAVPECSYRLFMDGDQWCCVGPEFINLQESDAGFGSTARDSLEALEMIEGEKERAVMRANDWKPSTTPQPPAHAPIDFLPHDDILRFACRVLSGDAPTAEDKAEAKRGLMQLRQSIRPSAPREPEWIDDPHDIEGGMMRNSKYVAPAPSESQAQHDNAVFERGYQHGRQQERQIHEYRAMLTPSEQRKPLTDDCWRPLRDAPDGERVLLGPRNAPVVGIVTHPVPWEPEAEIHCAVVHYNGNKLVAGYRCSEWHPLPVAGMPT